MQKKKVKLLRENFETRKAYFLSYFGREVEEMAIVSLGGCNFSCPYCKRGLQFVDDNGKVVRSVNIEWESLFKKIDEAIAKGQRVRLSGGTLVCFLRSP